MASPLLRSPWIRLVVAVFVAALVHSSARAQLIDPAVLFDPSRPRPQYEVASILDVAECPLALRRGYPIVTEGLGMHLDLLRARRAVDGAFRALQRVGDPTVLGTPGAGGSRRVCVGVYDDKGRPNAVAIGKETILFGTSLFDELRRRETGEELLSLVLTHELAHLLQNRHGRSYAVGQGKLVLEIASKRRKELVADCLAGSLTAMSRGGLASLQQLDLREGFFQFLGANHLVATHGLACQRKAAFYHGYFARNVPDPKAPGAWTSGALLAGCERKVDTHEFVWGDCR